MGGVPDVAGVECAGNDTDRRPPAANGLGRRGSRDGPVSPAAVGASSPAEADGSLALLVEYAGARILLSGPQGDSQRAAFVARTGGSPIDVLQVPDHGSASSVSDDFLAKIFPSSFMGQIRLAVLSYSARDVVQPDPGVLTRLTNANAQVLSTAANGAVTLTISSDGTPPVVTTER